MQGDVEINNFEEHLSKFNLPVITIFNKNTKDYKGKYIARIFDTKPGTIEITRYIVTSKYLVDIKNMIPATMIKFDRTEQDDPNIIETYV